MDNTKLIAVIAAALIIAVLIFNGNTVRTYKDCLTYKMPMNSEYKNYICLGIKSPVNETIQVDFKANDTCYQHTKGEKCSGIQIPTFIFDIQAS